MSKRGLIIGLIVVVVLAAMSFAVYFGETHQKVVTCPGGFHYVQDGGFGSHSVCVSDDGRTVIEPSSQWIQRG